MGSDLRVLLVRHGQSMGNADIGTYRHTPDHAVPLSPRGLEQARRAGYAISAFYQRLDRVERPPRRVSRGRRGAQVQRLMPKPLLASVRCASARPGATSSGG